MTMTFGAALFAFLTHFAVAMALMVLFLQLYTRVTPPDEFALVRAGNASATVSLAGAALGFAIVASRAIVTSGSLAEVAVWGMVGLAVQLLGFRLLSLFIPNLSAEIESGNVSTGILSAAASISLGLLNAACMTP
jgi:putative membrane protein